MKILGLDASTKTGYAIIEDGVLISFGLVRAESGGDTIPPDLELLYRADDMAKQISELVLLHKPDAVYIEQTNAGRFRGSQKQLEFIHCKFLTAMVSLKIPNVIYVDTSRWRSKLQIRLSKEQRVHNKLVREKKVRGKVTPKHLAVIWANGKFNLNLKLKDNDIADAMAIAHYGYEDMTKPKQIVSNRSVEDILLKK